MLYVLPMLHLLHILHLLNRLHMLHMLHILHMLPLRLKPPRECENHMCLFSIRLDLNLQGDPKVPKSLLTSMKCLLLTMLKSFLFLCTQVCYWQMCHCNYRRWCLLAYANVGNTICPWTRSQAQVVTISIGPDVTSSALLLCTLLNMRKVRRPLVGHWAVGSCLCCCVPNSCFAVFPIAA